MNFTVEAYLVLAIFLIVLNSVILCGLLIGRLKKDQREGQVKKKDFLNLLSGQSQPTGHGIDISGYLELKQSIKINVQDEKYFKDSTEFRKLENKNIKRLQSIFRVNRIEAAVYLGLIGSDTARHELEQVILKEKKYPVKLYMANALADIHDKNSIPVLISSLMRSHRWYRERVNMLITDFGVDFENYLPNILERQEIEIKELIVDFASVYYSESIKDYLVHLIDHRKEDVQKYRHLYDSFAKHCSNCTYLTSTLGGKGICQYRGSVDLKFCCSKYQVLPISVNYVESYNKLIYKAASVLGHFYPKLLTEERYLQSEDSEIKNIAVKTLSNINDKQNFSQLYEFLKIDETARSAVNAYAVIIERNPAEINHIIKRFEDEKDSEVKQRLAEVLCGKIEYLIMKLSTKSRSSAANVLKQILLLGKCSELIDFLNKNKDIDIENECIAIIQEVLNISSVIEDEFKRYLNQRILTKCGLESEQKVEIKKEEPRDKKLIRNLYGALALSILIFPLIYLIRHNNILLNMPLYKQLEMYIIDFNYYLAFYSIAINLVYLALLILSLINVRQQLKLWKIKKNSLLFKNRMLPSISIIAPAYNEEKTIIESSNSLLNLKYPDCELIIVNDGSKDRTLDVLLNYYGLTRVDYIFDYKLKTKQVRGIYMNPSLPKLIVVDKDNGGKADSLNAGINISNKEYFCGIDADSLLEDEALLKLASLTLDEGIETPALGGNIFPINGCKVEQGQIVDIQIPKNSLARFQSVEYLRAFMAGRLGWAKINSLLIISGAFGLFRKERVIGVGGYLTSSGKYAKDTVGEDMELVVRISRLMRELKQKYKICYAFNANCWTEVPEDLTSLKKQRYRWHRGLIDILTFHKKMLFNPNYGRTGILALPYFIIFEMFGPLVEIQGYMMVLAAFFLGLLNPEVALLLFIATILLGVFISVTSLIIAEKDVKYFRNKDLLILILYSIIENFGPRQLFSLWRVSGTLNMFRKPTGWGKLERKGFAAPSNSAKG